MSPLSLAHWVLDVAQFFTQPQRKYARKILERADARRRAETPFQQRARRH